MPRCTRETLLRRLLAHRHCIDPWQRFAVRTLIAAHIQAMRQA